MIICDPDKCTACGSCINKCPNNCITLKENEYGVPIAVVDKNRCVNCCLCQSVCPVCTPLKMEFPKSCYAAWRLDEKKLKCFRRHCGGIS